MLALIGAAAVLGLLVPPTGRARAAGARAAATRPTVFIDGEAGTTGLQVRERLANRAELELLSLPEEQRKDAEARAGAINAADAVILCLPGPCCK